MLRSLTLPELELPEIKAVAESCEYIKADLQDSRGHYRKVVGEGKEIKRRRQGKQKLTACQRLIPHNPSLHKQTRNVLYKESSQLSQAPVGMGRATLSGIYF